MDRQPTPDMSVGNALTGWQGKRRAPTHRAAKSGPSLNLLASRAMSQRSGPGFATAQTNSALSLAQRTGDARIESSTLEGQGVLAEGFQLGRGEAGTGGRGGRQCRCMGRDSVARGSRLDNAPAEIGDTEALELV
jgi:hypothetical protein